MSVLKVTDENSRIRVRLSEVRIRIRTKISRIRNIALSHCSLCVVGDYNASSRDSGAWFISNLLSFYSVQCTQYPGRGHEGRLALACFCCIETFT
jgi:hypothetical protein